MVVLLLLQPPPVRASVPQLPPGVYTKVLSGLAVPVANPGSSVTMSATLTDPLNATITSLNLTFELYAFNAYPGNSTAPLPSPDAPVFSTPSGQRIAISFEVASLSPGATNLVRAALSVGAAVAPGDYAIRTHLTFTQNLTSYFLESRGYFSYDQWTNATAGPNGTSTLNLTRLGVSGVIPETALSVQSNPYPIVLGVLLGGAVVLAAVGGYYAVARRSKSRSGARERPPPTNAPSAFGKSRKSDGD